MEILTSPAEPKPLFVPSLESVAVCLLSQDGSHGLCFNLCGFSMVEILIFNFFFFFNKSRGEKSVVMHLCTHKMYVCIFR